MWCERGLFSPLCLAWADARKRISFPSPPSQQWPGATQRTWIPLLVQVQRSFFQPHLLQIVHHNSFCLPPGSSKKHFQFALSSGMWWLHLSFILVFCMRPFTRMSVIFELLSFVKKVSRFGVRASPFAFNLVGLVNCRHQVAYFFNVLVLKQQVF